MLLLLMDTSTQAHPEFKPRETAHFKGNLVNDNTNSALFDRSVTVNGLKIVIAGAAGGQIAVPDEWARKTARVVDLMIDPDGNNVNLDAQKKLISTLKGEPQALRMQVYLQHNVLLMAAVDSMNQTSCLMKTLTLMWGIKIS